MIALGHNKGINGGTMNALQAANYFVELASETAEHDLTNLKLQKLLYYAQGKFLAKNGNPLFDDELIAWEYGPVVPGVYGQFKKCGSFPITVFDIETDSKIEDETKKGFLNSIWNDLGKKYSASYLVTCTHNKGTPWKAVFEPGTSNIIPKDSLKEYFQSHKL